MIKLFLLCVFGGIQSGLLGFSIEPPSESQSIEESVQIRDLPPDPSILRETDKEIESEGQREDRLERVFGKPPTYPLKRILNHYEKINLDFWKRPYLFDENDQIYGEKYPFLLSELFFGPSFSLGENASTLHQWDLGVLIPFDSPSSRNWQSLHHLALDFGFLTGEEEVTRSDGAREYLLVSQNFFALGLGFLSVFESPWDFLFEQRFRLQALLSPFRWHYFFAETETVSQFQNSWEIFLLLGYTCALHRLLSLGFRTGLVMGQGGQSRLLMQGQIGLDLLKSWKKKQSL